MNDTLICDELCELDLDVRSTDEFFEVMSKKAKDLGYVTEQFLSAIKKREQDYPTALPRKHLFQYIQNFIRCHQRSPPSYFSAVIPRFFHSTRIRSM